MTQAINLDGIIAEKVKTLPLEKQQQVLDFVEFLLSRTPQVEFKHPDGSPMSALEAAGDLVKCVGGGPGDLNEGSFLEATKEFAGCLEGEPSDLSTNKKYLENLGKA